MIGWLPRRHVLSALVTAVVLLTTSASRHAAVQTRTAFAAQIAALSEPGGYFDTDNLISNERSYLQVLPALQREKVRGGAYIGVGPDQNFSYIAEIRPSIAFIVDIRRDNLLLHLLFKALFAQARTRVEYLALLFGRAVPRESKLDDGRHCAGAACERAWRDAPIERLAAYIDDTPVDAQSADALRLRLDTAVQRFGIPLSSGDLATIDRFHRRFILAGLGLRFQSTGRPPQSHYPTYRDLLLETDPGGRHANFLASEDAFQFVKSLHARDRIIPVVGDLSGPKALVAIGNVLTRRGELLSAFYSSNVEFYLARAGTLPRFTENLSRVPRARGAVIIRAIFGRFAGGSTSVVQRIDELLPARTRQPVEPVNP